MSKSPSRSFLQCATGFVLASSLLYCFLSRAESTNAILPAEVSSHPLLSYRIQPLYDAQGRISAVAVDLQFEPLTTSSTTDLLLGAETAVEIPGLRIQDGTLKGRDSHGDIELISRSQTISFMENRIWRPTRPLDGPVHVSYVALPRRVDRFTRNGPALDYRLEGGGFMGSALSILIVPADLETVWDVSVSWDLEAAPDSPKTIWTFGEGPTAAHRLLDSMGVLWTYLAGGPLESYIDEQRAAVPTKFNTYWFGTLPVDTDQLLIDLDSTFHQMAEFFDDHDGFRIFLRHNPHPGHDTGTALQRSFMYGYDDSEYQHGTAPQAWLKTIAHEMVHNWIMFDPATEPTKDNWYPEGFAEYYALCFLYRSHRLSSEEFVTEINNRLSAYYTNPFARCSIPTLAELTWRRVSAQRLPYRRGFMLALCADYLIYTATQKSATLDDIVLKMVSRNRLNLPAGPHEFFSLLGEYIGDSALAWRIYDHVFNGTNLFVPPPDVLSHGRYRIPVTLHREDLEPLEFGFDEFAFSAEHVIRDLDPDSRAAAAGLQEGDHFQDIPILSFFEEHYPERVSLDVTDGSGQVLRTVKFWPRGFHTSESWHFEWTEENQEL